MQNNYNNNGVNLTQDEIFDKYIPKSENNNSNNNKINEQSNNLVVNENNHDLVKNNENKKVTLVEKFLNEIISYAETSGEVLDSKTKALAVDIITATNKALIGQQISWNMVDVAGCGVVSQIKRWAKLGVSMEDKLYPDIRKNGKTNLFDLVIKPQYQTVEKLIVKYFMLPVLRFKEDVICIGDVLVEEEDFVTGNDRIVSHKRNQDIDRNKIDNIIGAYKIMYIRDVDNNINQYVIKIDKNRIDRAYKASPSREKAVWNADTRKMILKTCTWEMWNDKNIRAFMKFPEDIVNDLSIIDETNEMDWSAETKFNNVNQAQENAQINVGNGASISMEFND